MNKIRFLLIVLSVFLLYGCNDNNVEQDESEVGSNIIVQEENLDGKFTVSEVVEYLCSEKVKDREYNKEGNQKATEYIDELYKQLNLEFVFGKSYLDNFPYDGRNISNVIGKISGNDSSTAIILTAHFDAWFNGAVDNASGVATVLEIAKLLEDTSKKESLNYEGTEKLNVFQVRLSTKQKIVNEAEAFSFINYFYLVIYIITRIFLS